MHDEKLPTIGTPLMTGMTDMTAPESLANSGSHRHDRVMTPLMTGAKFDQRDRVHQDWLLGKLAAEGLDGFYESQDIADLLQGRPACTLRSVVEGYRQRAAELTPQEFMVRLGKAKADRGVLLDPAWEAAEWAVRLRLGPHPLPPRPPHRPAARQPDVPWSR